MTFRRPIWNIAPRERLDNEHAGAMRRALGLLGCSMGVEDARTVMRAGARRSYTSGAPNTMTLTAGPCRNSYVERRASVACMCACVVRGSASRVVLVTEGKAQPLPLPLPPLHPRPRPPGGVAAMCIYRTRLQFSMSDIGARTVASWPSLKGRTARAATRVS